MSNPLFTGLAPQTISQVRAALAKAHTPTLARVEIYDNGPTPKAPRTQYGIVLDWNSSKSRINFNFGIVTDTQLASRVGSAGSVGDRNLYAMLKCWIANNYCNMPGIAHITVGKKNALAGTGLHNLKSGAKSLDYEVGAILVYDGSAAPRIHIFLQGTEVTTITPWVQTPNSSHSSKKWESYI